MDFKLATPFMEAFEELDKLNESPLKTWRISYYEDEVKKSFTVQAASKEEAEQIGWSRVDADSLYVSEVVNEDAKSDAGKRFWAAAKNSQIDLDAFHAAYDDELTELGMMDMFNEKGFLSDNYGKIKRAKDANPDSWALKALGKLWALRYKDHVDFPGEAEDRAASVQRMQAIRDQEAAKEKAALEAELANLRAKFVAHIPDVDPNLVAEYEEITGVKAEDSIEVVRGQMLPRKSFIAPAVYSYRLRVEGMRSYYPDVRESRLSDKIIISYLEGCFSDVVDRARAEGITDKFKHIDIFAAGKYATVILLGESGTVYTLEGSIDSHINAKPEVNEPYEVIYTCVQWSDNNHSTYSDSHSGSFISWNSKHVDKLGKHIPTEFGREEGYIGSYTETTKVSNPSDTTYSHEDGIDSWAEVYSVAGATD